MAAPPIAGYAQDLPLSDHVLAGGHELFTQVVGSCAVVRGRRATARSVDKGWLRQVSGDASWYIRPYRRAIGRIKGTHITARNGKDRTFGHQVGSGVVPADPA